MNREAEGQDEKTFQVVIGRGKRGEAKRGPPRFMILEAFQGSNRMGQLRQRIGLSFAAAQHQGYGLSHRQYVDQAVSAILRLPQKHCELVISDEIEYTLPDGSQIYLTPVSQERSINAL